ncbi:hypothetical protein B0H63DRAFT_564968 [Podospora didyma]|uniref:DUF7924 domain-containing protein n=1 Tax=Podospora didyma TaxID=330526 RepID=A0AAE0K1B3_9PEZI|nr:hypothetical protein B0H63DRAFT_564968 [Podospora didyma]
MTKPKNTPHPTKRRRLAQESSGRPVDDEIKTNSIEREFPNGIADDSEQWCGSILERARRIRLVLPHLDTQTTVNLLIFPLAKTPAPIRASPIFELLTETVNEPWRNVINQAFTQEQFAKLSPHIGFMVVGGLSLYMPTESMFFPFLSLETASTRSGRTADNADRKNTPTMSIAVRGVVELFKLVKRELDLDLDRQILAWSIA